MMLQQQATAASHQIYGLAEGPVWDATRDRVLWVDVNAGKVHLGKLLDDRIAPIGQFEFPGTASAVVCSSDGELLVAGSRALHTVALDGTVTTGPQLIPTDKPSRFNDGGCDPAGRFLVGSLTLDDDRQHEEVLLRVGHSGLITVIDDDLTLSNGLAWSVDGARFYSIDTVPGLVWSRTYDAATGRCGRREEFLHITDGAPDGMCVDNVGNLWLAIWGRGEVRCFTPAGRHLATVQVAAPNVSSVAFIGPDLDILLITTACEELSAGQRTRYPDSGRLFTCRVPATGLPLPPWSGR